MMTTTRPANQDAMLPMTNDNANGDSFPMGEERVVGQWRIWRGACVIRATHLANAGKRGKKCAVVAVHVGRLSDTACELTALLMSEIANIAKLDPNHPFADPDYMGTCFEARGLEVTRDQYRGVDVAPAGCPVLRFESDRVRFRFDLDGFSIQDLLDRNNEPTIISNGGKQSIAKAYKWARANAAKLVTMSFNEIDRALDDLKIPSHRYCAMD